MCWGDNDYGQLGTGVSGGVYSDDLIVADAVELTVLPAGPIRIAPGFDDTCASTPDGRVLCWGTVWNRVNAIEVDVE